MIASLPLLVALKLYEKGLVRPHSGASLSSVFLDPDVQPHDQHLHSSLQVAGFWPSNFVPQAEVSCAPDRTASCRPPLTASTPSENQTQGACTGPIMRHPALSNIFD